jgi:chorismate mutase
VSEPDPVLSQFREQVSEIDRAILDAVNTRLELVAQIKAYKASRGIDFLDPARERSMLDDLARANGGPLSTEGLHELFTTILDLTKREVADGGSG